MLPSKPPKYTPSLPEYIPIHYRVYHQVEPKSSENLHEAEEDSDQGAAPRRRMLLTKQEKCFLMVFTGLAFLSLNCTSMAIMLDKHGITGTITHPSTCLLTDSRDCRTVYTTEVVRKMVEVSVRVDLLLSCVAVTAGAVLTAFQMFNCRLLIGFLLTGIFKAIFINTALLLILTNTSFYFNTVYNALSGNCGQQFCLEEETTNIVVAFVLLTISGFLTFVMTLTVFVLGSHILRKYDDVHDDILWAKWDIMTDNLTDKFH